MIRYMNIYIYYIYIYMIPIKSNKCQIYLDRSLGETSLAIIIMSSDTVFFPAVSGQ